MGISHETSLGIIGMPGPTIGISLKTSVQTWVMHHWPMDQARFEATGSMPVCLQHSTARANPAMEAGNPSAFPSPSDEPFTQSNPDAKRPRRCIYVKAFKPDGTSEMHEFEDWPLDVPVSRLVAHIANQERVPDSQVKIYVQVPGVFNLEDFWISDHGPEPPLLAWIEQ